MNVSTLALRHQGALETAAKAGWMVKGALYITLGMLASFAAAGAIEGSKRISRLIAQQPFGRALLMLAGVGFACYALWRCVQAVVDPADHDDTTSMVTKRIAWIASGLAHGSLAVAAFELVVGMGSSGGGRSVWVVRLLEAGAAGRVVLGALGLVIILAGLCQLKNVFEPSFMEKVDRAHMSSRELGVFEMVGRAGLMSRAIVFPIIGCSLVDATVSHSPAMARGTGDALGEAAQLSWHALAIIAVGMVIYGVLQLFYARYRRPQLG